MTQRRKTSLVIITEKEIKRRPITKSFFNTRSLTYKFFIVFSILLTEYG